SSCRRLPSVSRCSPSTSSAMPCATSSIRPCGGHEGPNDMGMTEALGPKPATTAATTAARPLLEARALKVWFARNRGFLRGHDWVRAVDGVDRAVSAGEPLAVVGESGCGKTTLGRALSLLQRPTAGTVAFAEAELTQLTAGRLRAARRHLQMIFQDPYASLD